MKRALIAVLVMMFFLTLVGTSALAQQGKKTFGAGLELALPMGDFGDAANTGFGATAAFQYEFKPNIDLVGVVGYLHWGGKNSLGDVDYSWNAIPIQVGGKYFFQTTESRFYVGGLVGFHIFSSKVPVFVLPAQQYESHSETETKMGLAPLGGYELKVGENMILDFQARYQFVSDDLSYFGVRVGLSFGL